MRANNFRQPENSDTVAAEITTAALLQKLAPYGVTENDLKNQIRRSFLPHPIGGLWPAWAVRRAKRLYRLRKRGAHGVPLKILLFLSDGWGWEGVREVCTKGLQRMTAFSLNGVERYASSDASLNFAIEDIAQHQHKALVSKVGDRPDLKPISNEMTAFYVGMLHGGVPLEGGSSRRLAAPLAKAFWPSISDGEANFFAFVLDVIVGFLDLRASRLVARLEGAGREDVERGRLSLLKHVRIVRHVGRRLAGTEAKGNSFNLLTFFGYAEEMKAQNFSQGDIKLSPTLLLAGLVGSSVAMEIALSEFVERAPRLIRTLFNSHKRSQE